MAPTGNQRIKAAGTPFAPPSSKPWLVRPPDGWVATIAKTATVFFRRDFGERFLNPRTISRGTFALAFYLVAVKFYVGGGQASAVTPPVPVSTWITWIAYSMLYVIYVSSELFRAACRQDRFPDEFSSSDGRPREILFRVMPFLHDEWDFERFYEPAMCIAIGSLLTYFHNLFGPDLILAGCCAFYVARIKYIGARAMDLNLGDAQTQADAQPRLGESRRIEPIKPISTHPPQR